MRKSLWSNFFLQLGQHISLSLLTFDLLAYEEWVYPEEAIHSSCAVDLYITEHGDKTKVDICNVKQREKDIYKSTVNVIVVEVATWKSTYRTPRFMLEYQGKYCD